ncbi:MAG: serine hydrolase [Thermoplasmatales archaeon]
MKRFIKEFNSNEYDSIYSKTNQRFKDRISLSNFTSILTSVAQKTGKIKYFEFEQKKDEALEVFNLFCERQSIILTLGLDDRGKVGTLLLRPLQAGAGSEKKSVDQLINEWKNDKGSQALVIGEVSKDNAHYQFLGSVDKERQLTPTMKTLFEIGSITKPLAGLILHAMILEGKLSLDDPINKFLPDSVQLPKVNNQEVLLKHLVTHSSCFPRLPDNMKLSIQQLQNPYQSYTNEDLLRFLKKITLSCELGKHQEYSNVGAGLLGYVITHVSQKTFDELVNEYIAKPINSNEIGILGLSPDWATGYNFLGMKQENWTFTSAMVAAGGIDANASSMEKLLRILMHPDNSILGKAIIASKNTKINGVQELGTFWVKQSINNKTIIWHNGQTGGFSAFIGWVEEDGMGVFVLSNNSTITPTKLGLAYLEKLINAK